MLETPATTATRLATRASRAAIHAAACDIIAAEYRDDLSIEVVARRLCVSPRQLQRAFSQAGSTFSRQVRDVRLDAAALLLETTEVPIADIATTVRYAPAQFAKAFCARLHTTPSEYRHATARVSIQGRFQRPRTHPPNRNDP